VTPAAIVSLLIAIFKAIPALERQWDAAVVAYIKQRRDVLRKETRDAIKKALDDQDQIDLENSMGAVEAGQQSHRPGAVLVDSLPGLRDEKPDKKRGLVE